MQAVLEAIAVILKSIELAVRISPTAASVVNAVPDPVTAPAALRAIVPVAVSYTHLTLPTIYSV